MNSDTPSLHRDVSAQPGTGLRAGNGRAILRITALECIGSSLNDEHIDRTLEKTRTLVPNRGADDDRLSDRFLNESGSPFCPYIFYVGTAALAETLATLNILAFSLRTSMSCRKSGFLRDHREAPTLCEQTVSGLSEVG